MDNYAYYSSMSCSVCHTVQEFMEINHIAYCKKCNPGMFYKSKYGFFGHSEDKDAAETVVELPKIIKAIPCIKT